MHLPRSRPLKPARVRKPVAALTAVMSIALGAAALTALPATAAHAAVLSPSLPAPNGSGWIYDIGIKDYLAVSGGFVTPWPESINGVPPTFYNGPVAPSGYFEIQLGPGASGGCLSVNTGVTYLGYPTVTVQNQAGCTAGGNGYVYDHWSARIIGYDSSGTVAQYAFENASDNGNGTRCLYLNQNVAIVTSCSSDSTNPYQRFEWIGSGLPGS